jgi:ribosomal protein S18 acetylase RimI-like enzyme
MENRLVPTNKQISKMPELSITKDGSLSLRTITPEDRKFLFLVYASTRQPEMAALEWTVNQKIEFLRMQFNAQHTYYQEQFSNASFQIILLNGEPIGRLYVDHRDDEIRIIDIALLMEYRNQGFGTELMTNILTEAKNSLLPVRIHVEQFNPAMQLYKRLGFYEIDHTGVYVLMEWSPDEAHARQAN